MTATLLLVLHGQTTSNTTGFYMGWSEEDLNEVGYLQAQRLSSRLASLPIDSIYSSPLRRTYSTATILAEPRHLGVNVLNDLIEIKLGGWEGLHKDEIKRRYPELWQQSRIDPSGITMPGGESFPQVTERAVRALEMIAAANEGKQAVIVTHEVVIKVLIAYALGVTNSIYRRIAVDNASLSTIRVNSDNTRVITMNDVSHLG